jgi:hypothetical protein
VFAVIMLLIHKARDEPDLESPGEGPLKVEEGRAGPAGGVRGARGASSGDGTQAGTTRETGDFNASGAWRDGVSAAPVFIPAARVQQELTQKAEAGTKEEGAVEMPVTVELLTQRWVQGLVL